MRDSGENGGGGKRGTADRTARLAAKLRQNLVRRKARARAIGEAATLHIEADAAGPGGDSSSRDDNEPGA